MKKLLILSIFLGSIVACQSQQSVETANVVTTSIETKMVQATAPTFKVPSFYKGTIPAEGLPIATDYPFDVKLTDADGTALNSSKVFKQNGKPTILLFWLTTCYPCGLELNALKEKYPKWIDETEFNLYAISTDYQKNYAQFQKRVKTNNWTFEAYHDTDRKFLDIMPGNLNGLPQVFIFDAQGNIVYHKRKYSPGDEDKLLAQVKSMK